MPKFDDVMQSLKATNEITKEIQRFLYNSDKEDLTEISSHYSTRKELLENLQTFFTSGDIVNFSQRQRDLVNSLVKEIIQYDKQNIMMIESKVNEYRNSVKNIQKQKSLLIYSKS
jgi:hypothetical protein